MADNRLTGQEVKRRLSACDNAECISELYSFGITLVNESLDTLHRLDAKAYAVAGYSGAAFTALISLVALLEHIGPGTLSPVIWPLAVVSTLGAAGLSLLAIKFRPADWFSPNDWFREECLGDVNFLRRYRVLCMYWVQQSHRRLAWGKIRHIKWAVRVLFTSGVLLCFAVALAPASLVKVAWAYAALKALRIGVW